MTAHPLPPHFPPGNSPQSLRHLHKHRAYTTTVLRIHNTLPPLPYRRSCDTRRRGHSLGCEPSTTPKKVKFSCRPESLALPRDVQRVRPIQANPIPPLLHLRLSPHPQPLPANARLLHTKPAPNNSRIPLRHPQPVVVVLSGRGLRQKILRLPQLRLGRRREKQNWQCQQLGMYRTVSCNYTN